MPNKRFDFDINAPEIGLAAGYEDTNYSGLTGYVLRAGHSLIEGRLDGRSFAKVLEIGGGGYPHFKFVRHDFAEYVLIDSDAEALAAAQAKLGDLRTKTVLAEAEGLPFEDAEFDRVIASHVLEHVYYPHKVLKEWDRVLKPGGLLSIVLPCDPGLAWRLGRHFGPRRRLERKGVPYDYVMARYHVNPFNALLAMIRFFFGNCEEKWWPWRIPSMDMNLIYTVNIIKKIN
jgi:ubiquinone/menaquinone biosynthesis C-methylase UbiE